jgi:hypothetical protein
MASRWRHHRSPSPTSTNATMPRQACNISTSATATATRPLPPARHLGPILQGVDINRYAYAGNDPINGSDPNGHWTEGKDHDDLRSASNHDRSEIIAKSHEKAARIEFKKRQASFAGDLRTARRRRPVALPTTRGARPRIGTKSVSPSSRTAARRTL